MTTAIRGTALIFAIAALLGLTGCSYTTAGTKLAAIAPPTPSVQPSIQYTVGDYEFRLEGGAMISSESAGKLVNDAIMESWKERGYVRSAESVEPGQFGTAADYHVTLSGTQYGESSVFLQIISGLTLMILPYYVDQHYDVQYMAVDVKSGKTYSASVQDANTAYVELFLIFAFPFVGTRGQQAMMTTMGDHLYAQLREQGAFNAPAAGAPAAAAAPASP